MADTVGEVFAGIPVVDTEVGGPAGVEDLFFGDFFPSLTVLDFEADFLDLVRFEREKLGRHLEGVILKGVNGETNDLIAWDVEVDHGLLLFGCALTLPPFAGGPVIEAGVFLAEELGGSGHHLAGRGKGEN